MLQSNKKYFFRCLGRGKALIDAIHVLCRVTTRELLEIITLMELH